jgi:predicted HTH transcriptional regulator
MTETIDLQQLATRESEQTEWKASVADVDDVVATLAAFANDLANLGGGYVVCGAEEHKDEHGFPKLARTGLTASRLKEVENQVLAKCRDRVSPSIAPRVEELPAESSDRRILVFIQPSTARAHTFRRGSQGEKHYVRVGRSTNEARNGVLRDLLVRKGALEPWDRRPCTVATQNDLDLLVLRDALQRIGMFAAERGIEPYLSEEPINPFVPSLCVREPLTGVLRPRNFAILLFGRVLQKYVPGAFSLFSIYPGTDRSDAYAERHEIAGGLIEQSRRLTELLDVQSYTAFDKQDPKSPNVVKYPRRALYEAMGNALAHRDYELADPTRITVFADRIEVLSPGSLPLGVDPVAFREGRAAPKWRNQALAWFFNRLQLAQAEGQGIPTILRVMREEGCPPPILESDETRVLCVLPAHPRHALLRELRAIEQAIALGEIRKAQVSTQALLARDPLNYRALQLFAEIQHELREPQPVLEWVVPRLAEVKRLPSGVLVALSEALMSGDQPTAAERDLSQKLLRSASSGRLEEREFRRIAVAMLRAGDAQEVLSLIDRQLQEQPESQGSASVRQLRGDALIGLAKRCRTTGRRRKASPAVKQRAWRDFHAYLGQAEQELRRGLELSVDDRLTEQLRRNLEYLESLRRENQPPRTRH